MQKYIVNNQIGHVHYKSVLFQSKTTRYSMDILRTVGHQPIENIWIRSRCLHLILNGLCMEMEQTLWPVGIKQLCVLEWYKGA